MPELVNNTATDASLNLIDETFDISQAGSYHLSIQSGEDGLSLCVLNTVINKYIVLRNYPFRSFGKDETALSAYRRIFDNDDILRLRYKSCSHVWVSPRCTLFPGHLFDPENSSACLNFNHGRKAGESTLYNHLHVVQLYNIFSQPDDLGALLKQYQPDITLCHHATLFVNWMISRSYATSRPLVAIYYYGNYADIMVIRDRKLLFYNTFYINNPEDSIYYLTGILNLFDMQLASTAISYVGDLHNSPDNVEIIRKYALRIIECSPLDTATYSHYMTESLRKRFTHLFNLQGCAS